MYWCIDNITLIFVVCFIDTSIIHKDFPSVLAQDGRSAPRVKSPQKWGVSRWSVEVALMGLETWGKGWEWDGNGMLMDFGEVLFGIPDFWTKPSTTMFWKITVLLLETCRGDMHEKRGPGHIFSCVTTPLGSIKLGHSMKNTCHMHTLCVTINFSYCIVHTFNTWCTHLYFMCAWSACITYLIDVNVSPHLPWQLVRINPRTGLAYQPLFKENGSKIWVSENPERNMQRMANPNDIFGYIPW